jgi:arabinose-5-phosphate isomerase
MSDADEIIQIGKDVLKLAADSISLNEQSLGESFLSAVHMLHRTNGSIIVCGIGKSGIVAKKLAATLSSTGTPSYFIHPVEAFHGDFGMIKPGDTLIMLSHSGETDELIRFLKVVRNLHSQNKVLTITAKNNSTLAIASDAVVLTHVVIENHNEDCRRIPTTSTTVTLAIGDAIAIALQRLKGFKAADFLQLHPGGNIGKTAESTIK